MQPLNAPASTVLRLFGIVTLTSFEQLANAFASIVITPSGITTVVKSLQLANKFAGIAVMPSEKPTELILQFKNALVPIDFKVEGSFTSTSFEQ